MDNLQIDFESYLTGVEHAIGEQLNSDYSRAFDSNTPISSTTNVEPSFDTLAHDKLKSEQPIEKSLSKFKSHGLDDLNAAKLMDRVDSKFILPIAFLPELLSQLKHHYSVLEINNNRISSYQNKYFDTPDMELYNNHHNGKLNRYKVRQRRYVDTNTEFLEVKLKNNKKRTIKNRIMLSPHTSEEERCSKFIDQQISLSPLTPNNESLASENLSISQQSGYKRIALANEAAAERLTLDFGLWYQGINAKNKVKLPGFFIAELKQKKKSKRSPFYQMMSANNIVPSAFSKYCIGCALLYKSSIKSNRFKPILSQIEKLNHLKQISFLKSI